VSSAPTTAKKALRVGLIRNGKIVEERLFRHQEAVTIGVAPRVTFSVDSPLLGQSFTLLAHRGGIYRLAFVEGMQGKIATDDATVNLDDSVISLETLKSQQLVTRSGREYHLPLTETTRGKVVMGETTLLFQFVLPPLEPVQPVLPEAAQYSIWTTIYNERIYLASLLLWTVISVVLLAWGRVQKMEPLSKADMLKKLPDRFAKLVMEKPVEIKPMATDPSLLSDERKKDVADADADRGKAEKKPTEQQRAAMKKRIASKGLIGLIGTTRSDRGGGAVANLFAEGGLGQDLDAALATVGGVQVASSDTPVTARSAASGSAAKADIGDLATSGGGQVALGGKQEKQLQANITRGDAEIEGSLDEPTINRVVQRHMSGIKYCYERELKRNANLAGKIVLRWTIEESGRVSGIEIEQDTMQNRNVSECMKSKVRTWRFPAPGGGSVLVAYPFIFQSSG